MNNIMNSEYKACLTKAYLKHLTYLYTLDTGKRDISDQNQLSMAACQSLAVGLEL